MGPAVSQLLSNTLSSLGNLEVSELTEREYLSKGEKIH